LTLEREVQRANALIAEVSRIPRPDPKSASVSSDELTGLQARREKSGVALQQAHSILKTNPDYPPAKAAEAAAQKASDINEADGEAIEARKLTAAITESIARYKNQTLSERQAEQIRDDLRKRCKAAVDHADRAINLDPNNYLAWIEKVRALRLMADDSGAKQTLQRALDLFPGDAELQKLQKLLRG